MLFYSGKWTEVSNSKRSLEQPKICYRVDLISFSSQVTPEDMYPQQLCAKCWKQCRASVDFIALAKESDRQLKEYDPKDENIVKVKQEPEEYSEELEEKKDDIIMVKEEQPEVYLEGYSLAAVSEEEADDEVKIEDLSVTETDTDSDEEYNRKGPSKMKNKRNNFECGKCSRSFRDSYDLERHWLVHSNKKHFQCNECDKKFTQKNNLVRHQNMHAKIKPFQCDKCDHKCTQKNDLIRHKRSHTNDTPFKCNLCFLPLKHETSLGRHMMRFHK